MRFEVTLRVALLLPSHMTEDDVVTEVRAGLPRAFGFQLTEIKNPVDILDVKACGPEKDKEWDAIPGITREALIDTAVGLNENYRTDETDHDLELGFLYGTAEMVVASTLKPDESYHDLREAVAAQIDKAAAEKTYPIMKVNGYKEKGRAMPEYKPSVNIEDVKTLGRVTPGKRAIAYCEHCCVTFGLPKANNHAIVTCKLCDAEDVIEQTGVED